MADTTLQERLYALLPTIHRIRDAERGQVLRALLGLLETELDGVKLDIDGLYDNWFIETCDPWVVPYIADLLGIEGISSEEGYSRRAVVANTVAWRRRKGTASVLESLAFAETGWQARAVEFFQLLSTTQHLNHLRPQSVRGVDIRQAHRLELLGGPFETQAHTAEVRRADSTQGRYNIPNVGLMLWRLNTYHVHDATARWVSTEDLGADGKLLRYRFDALDRDVPLFNGPRTEGELSSLTTEIDVPGRLRNRGLAKVLDDPTSWPDEHAWWFTADDEPAFQVRIGAVNDDTPVAYSEDELRFFVNWRREDPAEEEALGDWDQMVTPTGTTLVDVERGRLVIHLAAGVPEPEEVRVDFRYAFSEKLGGGPYDRSASLSDDESWSLENFDSSSDGAIQLGVSRKHHQETALGATDPSVYETITEALDAWNTFAAAHAGGCKGLIVLMDSRTYVEDLTGAARIIVPQDCELWIIAADWETPSEDSGYPTDLRRPGSATPDGVRPHLRGDVEIEGSTGSGERGRLYLNGLRIEGNIDVLEGDLGGLTIRHCTQVPGDGRRLSVTTGANPALELIAARSILGGLAASTTLEAITLTECIVDRFADERAIDVPETDLVMSSVTVLGTTDARTASATDSLFCGRLEVALKQEGCLRFCWVSTDSVAPRRYRCQPETALESASADLLDALEARIVPSFTSRRYGSPGYAQLRRLCRDEIRAGSENGAEMGAFTFLRQPQRERNLQSALRQYLRFGLSSGLFFVT